MPSKCICHVSVKTDHSSHRFPEPSSAVFAVKPNSEDLRCLMCGVQGVSPRRSGKQNALARSILPIRACRLPNTAHTVVDPASSRLGERWKMENHGRKSETTRLLTARSHYDDNGQPWGKTDRVAVRFSCQRSTLIAACR